MENASPKWKKAYGIHKINPRDNTSIYKWDILIANSDYGVTIGISSVVGIQGVVGNKRPQLISEGMHYLYDLEEEACYVGDNEWEMILAGQYEKNDMISITVDLASDSIQFYNDNEYVMVYNDIRQEWKEDMILRLVVNLRYVQDSVEIVNFEKK